MDTKSLNYVAFVFTLSGSTSVFADPAWSLIHADEFDGNTLDRSVWQNEVNCYGGGNNELQCYTDGDHNLLFENGNLIIEAREEQARGPAHFDDSDAYSKHDRSARRGYTSARIRTKNLLDLQYGRIEVRAKLPHGQGLWPAIWMLPTENRYGGWPHSGEIDIMEAINLNAEGADNLIYGTLHYGEAWPNNSYSNTTTDLAPTPWLEFHEYAIEWEQNEIRWFIDGQHYATQRPATTSSLGWFTVRNVPGVDPSPTSDAGIPFNHPFHLILNVAVGGDWPGDVGDSTVFPQRMEIDYVRVYQCEGGNERGEGCRGLMNDINPQVSLSGYLLPDA